MAQVDFSIAALNDLNAIYLYISANSEAYAYNVINKIYKRVEILESHIQSGRVVPEFNNPAIREIIEGSYRIIYRIKRDNNVSIARIYHTARSLKKL